METFVITLAAVGVILIIVSLLLPDYKKRPKQPTGDWAKDDLEWFELYNTDTDHVEDVTQLTLFDAASRNNKLIEKKSPLRYIHFRGEKERGDSEGEQLMQDQLDKY